MSRQPDMIMLQAELAVLKAERAVRAVVMRYFALCDRLSPKTALDQLGACFTHDAVWEGRGRYRAAFGEHSGREAIVAMLAGYAGDPPHFVMNAHFLSSEAIEAGEGGAIGRWMMLQTSTYRDGRSDLRSAALTIRCAVEDGEWRIAHFVTENIFAREVGPWSDAAPISVPDANAKEE